jgi:hypothetical protein
MDNDARLLIAIILISVGAVFLSGIVALISEINYEMNSPIVTSNDCTDADISGTYQGPLLGGDVRLVLMRDGSYEESFTPRSESIEVGMGNAQEVISRTWPTEMVSPLTNSGHWTIECSGDNPHVIVQSAYIDPMWPSCPGEDWTSTTITICRRDWEFTPRNSDGYQALRMVNDPDGAVVLDKLSPSGER